MSSKQRRLTAVTSDDSASPALGLDEVERMMRLPGGGPDVEEEHVRDRMRRSLFERGSDPPRIGRYIVLRKLGEGAMGQVFEARDPQLDRRIAVKILRSTAKIPVEATAVLVREAKALARLSHPNVVGVYDAGYTTWRGGNAESEVAFIAMELVQGEPLRTWLAARSRSKREIGQVFVETARGLAAAHCAHLIHRDFKPDNVVIGDAGRPRVVDFGLARHAGAASPQGGSPTYVAPECHAGSPADARSDQYSFCVSLFEALAGRRPFDEPTRARLLLAKRERKDREFGRRVIPRRFWQVVDRGLDPDPQARYPSMDALIQALERATGRRRGAAAVAVAAIAIAATSWLAAPSDEPCERAASELDAAWNPAAADRQRRAFERSGAQGAAQTWENARERLDTYARSWRTQRRAACDAMLESGGSGPAAHAWRSCLDQQLVTFSATVEALEAGDRGSVHHAIEAVEALRDPAQCRTGVAPQPVGGEVGRALAVARARRRAGDMRRARDAAEEALQIGYGRESPPRVIAEVLIELGDLQMRAGDHAQAQESLHEAVLHAERVNDERLASIAWTKLALMFGVYQRDTTQALAAADMAQAKLEQAGPHPEIRSEILLARANALADTRRFDEAIASYNAAGDLGRDTNDALLVAEVQNGLGIVRHVQHELDAAEAHYGRAAESFERELGPHHPSLARVLTNWAGVLRDRDDLEGARAKQRRAVAIARGALGDRHPLYAGALINAASVENDLGSPEAAVELYRSGLDVLIQHYGDRHPDVALTRSDLGVVLAHVGEHDAAVAQHRAALAAHEDLGPAYAVEAGDDRLNLALSLVELGQIDAARPLVAAALSGLANEAPADTGRYKAARMFAVAEVWIDVDAQQAHRLALRARDVFRATGERDLQVSVGAWLRAAPRLTRTPTPAAPAPG